jgi:undecaprenyl-diphosphatase
VATRTEKLARRAPGSSTREHFRIPPLLAQVLGAAVMLAAARSAWAGGLLGIDHPVTPTESGIWARGNTLGLEYGVVAVELGGALWFGGESKVGKTFWQTIDASIFGQVAAQGAKYAFGRERPSQTSNPDEWFKGFHAQSFPSGEVTLQASVVTPFIVNYAECNPWAWALEVLPAYDAAARVKQGAHWQSDVLAGWALGSTFGYFAARNQSPLVLNALPHGFMIGIQARF